MRRLVLLSALLLLAGCGDETATPRTAPAPTMPASYSFDLESSCGERNLIGTFHVWVEDGEVTRAEPTGRTEVEPVLEYVPTLDDLERMLADAEPDAIVETERDADGVLTWLSIDHLPDAIDDEECYRVTSITVAASEDEPVVSCGGGGPGWPVSAMDGGIEAETPDEEIDAALTKSQEDMGIDGPIRGGGWIVLAEDGDSLTLGTGHWGPDGPDRDALVVGYEKTPDGLEWTGHGTCSRLAPVLPDGQDWVEVTAPDGGLDRDTADLTVLVMEHQCTGARDPLPYLNEPQLLEEDDRVVVTMTSPWPEGDATCPGNPRTPYVLHLSEPLGDRQLLDGSTWPATVVGSPS